MSLLFAFLNALPALWALYCRLVRAGSQDPVADLERIHEAFVSVRNAKTQEEQSAAANRLLDIL